MLFLVESTHQTTATFKVNNQTHPVIAFQCKHIEALANHLKRNAVKVENNMDDGLGNLFLDFYDPDGNKFNVQCDKVMNVESGNSVPLLLSYTYLI
ncbi:VOC family protein [Shouchella clausii]|uniref:VOC family protein n=1 Tax=Shouchella clausii TaxID=79880 RepID=UPI00311E2174